MATNIKITYTNKSMKKDLPTVFIFTKNETPTFDVLKEGVAWHTIPNRKRGSSSSFVFPTITEFSAKWQDGINKVQVISSDTRKHYTVSKAGEVIAIEDIENDSEVKFNSNSMGIKRFFGQGWNSNIGKKYTKKWTRNNIRTNMKIISKFSLLNSKNRIHE